MRRSIKQVPNYVRSLDVHVENIQFTIENVLVFELQSIPRIDRIPRILQENNS